MPSRLLIRPDLGVANKGWGLDDNELAWVIDAGRVWNVRRGLPMRPWP